MADVTKLLSDSLNSVPRQPKFAHHRRDIAAADSGDPVPFDAGISCKGWKSIWVDVHFTSQGTETCTLRPLFYNPAGDPQGSQQYQQLWFEQGGLADLVVAGGDGGHRSFLVDVHERHVFFKAVAVGAGAEFSVSISGAEAAVAEHR